ncbi:hypothetical protein [Streptococcus oralis]|uniref:hypothetical protein n=1 Tax=Streptococcus oralis TaxID=1303 RepID=UPI0002583F1C|nr:hypothetical protein [Streptococcus oralis]EIC76834.1 hypothetical protein HMPREF1114_0294 [Streptococcus oralis SK100]KZX08090.1 hypothetical protein A4224_06205 [Streptococcus oralis]
MFENEMDILADEFFDIVKRVFKDKIDDIVFDDIADEPNHQTFKLDFKAYDYFTIQFDYENDLWFFIVLTKEAKISLTKGPAVYSQITDWDSYLKEIMEEIELRIPDKFLKAKGWL